jgi:hypothetical protein
VLLVQVVAVLVRQELLELLEQLTQVVEVEVQEIHLMVEWAVVVLLSSHTLDHNNLQVEL